MFSSFVELVMSNKYINLQIFKNMYTVYIIIFFSKVVFLKDHLYLFVFKTYFVT